MTSSPWPSRFWSELSTRDFASVDAERAVAVLPVAATEQHGPHLPLGVDTTLADGVVQASLGHLRADLPVLFLPTQAVGLSSEHTAFAGTLTLSPQTLITLWCELGACVARAGFRKLVLFNAHGGNVAPMDIVARELRGSHRMLVYSTNWYTLPLGEAVDSLFSAQEHRFGIHGGAIETSMMLALQPGQVRMDQAMDFASTSEQRARNFPILGNGRSARLGWQMQDYNPLGAVGRASDASADKGRALLQAAGRQLASLLAEVSAVPLSSLVTDKHP